MDLQQIVQKFIARSCFRKQAGVNLKGREGASLGTEELHVFLGGRTGKERGIF